jgi:hypothetical protein
MPPPDSKRSPPGRGRRHRPGDEPLARHLEERLLEINLTRPSPVIIEIPGIDDQEGFRRSAVGYISEALAFSL